MNIQEAVDGFSELNGVKSVRAVHNGPETTVLINGVIELLIQPTGDGTRLPAVSIGDVVAMPVRPTTDDTTLEVTATHSSGEPKSYTINDASFLRAIVHQMIKFDRRRARHPQAAIDPFAE